MVDLTGDDWQPMSVVGELAQSCASDVVDALARVVLVHRARALAGQVRGMQADSEERARALEARQAKLRACLSGLDDSVVMARADRDLAQQRRARVMAGVDGGQGPDVGAAVDALRNCERERGKVSSELTITRNRLGDVEARARKLADLLGRLEAVDAPDSDLLAVLARGLAGGE